MKTLALALPEFMFERNFWRAAPVAALALAATWMSDVEQAMLRDRGAWDRHYVSALRPVAQEEYDSCRRLKKSEPAQCLEQAAEHTHSVALLAGLLVRAGSLEDSTGDPLVSSVRARPVTQSLSLKVSHRCLPSEGWVLRGRCRSKLSLPIKPISGPVFGPSV